METKDEIFKALTQIMIDLFELEESTIRMEARLFEDLDLDSIDAIDMIVEVQKITEHKIKPDDFQNVRTIEDIVNTVYAMIHESH